MALFVKYTVMVSVILLMLGVGMGVSFRQLVDAIRQFAMVLRGVLANFFIVPVLIYLVLLILPLTPDVKIGIMLMAAAPVAPMAPSFVAGAKRCGPRDRVDGRGSHAKRGIDPTDSWPGTAKERSRD